MLGNIRFSKASSDYLVIHSDNKVEVQSSNLIHASNNLYTRYIRVDFPLDQILVIHQ